MRASTKSEARRCDDCGEPSRVINVRERKLSVWRVHECLKCGARWDTYESKIDPEDLPASIRERAVNI